MRLSRPILSFLAVPLAVACASAVSLAQPATPAGPPQAPPGVSASAAPQASASASSGSSPAPLPPAPPGVPLPVTDQPTAPPAPYLAGYPPPTGSTYPPYPYGPPAASEAAPPGYAPYPYPYPYPYYPYGYPPGYGAAAPPAHPAPAPRPSRPPERGVHLHDGFFLQMTPGVGYMHNAVSLKSSPTSISIGGLTTGFDISYGGSPVPGFVLAADVGRQRAGGADVSGDVVGSSATTTVSYTSFSLLADGYPNPARGFHLQAGLGYGVVSLYNMSVGPVYGPDGKQRVAVVNIGDMGGLHVNLGLGQEWFISSQWSLGVLFRFDFAAVGVTTQDVATRATMLAPTLRMSITYH